VAKRVNDEEEEEENSAIVSTDMRLAAMGIISFIPYFNWLSWVFAWLDTGKSRYAVYALVYLVPYLSSNLSISPEESWLPITSIVLGIIHVQVLIIMSFFYNLTKTLICNVLCVSSFFFWLGSLKQASQMGMLRHLHSSETHLMTIFHLRKESILRNISREKTVTMKIKNNSQKTQRE
jgi:hypothetical protein